MKKENSCECSNQGGKRYIFRTIKIGNLRRFKEMKKIYALGLEELIQLKWLDYPKQSTDLMQSLSKYPRHFSLELEQIILKLIQNTQRPCIEKAILRRKGQS